MLDLLLVDNPIKPIFWLIVTFGILLLVLVITLPIIVVAGRRKDKRRLIGIELDTDIVKRKFTVGDEFECVGLVVKAQYNVEPTTESVVKCVLITEGELEEGKSKGEVNGCYVVKPNMDEAGKKAVTVIYQDKVALYTIAVAEAVEEQVVATVAEPIVEQVVEPVIEPIVVAEPEPQPIIIEEESADNRLRYDKSFTARFIQSDDEVKQWYTELKNDLLSYKKVKSRMSWKRETFKIGKEVVAKISFRGKTMCLYLPLNAADFAESKYHVEDVSDTPSNVDTPVMYRLKNARRVKYATDLIAMVMDRFGLVRVERIAEDYYMPYEGIVELINKGLVKRKIKSAQDEAVFLQNKKDSLSTNNGSEPQEVAPGLYVTTK